MGRLFSRGALSLFLTLACAGGTVVVTCAADAAGESLRVVKDVTDSIRRGETPRPQDACPAALAPAVREFEAKCAAKTATRGDLIALKKFIAVSVIDGATKTNLTRQVRKMYQESKKKEKVESRSRG